LIDRYQNAKKRLMLFDYDVSQALLIKVDVRP
jgi:trehalose-6-phosphatase